MSDYPTPPRPRALDSLLGRKPIASPAAPLPVLEPQSPIEPPQAVSDDDGHYRAFYSDRGNRRQMTLELRSFERRTGIEEAYLLPMHQFVQAHAIGPHVTLHFSHTVVRIEGRGVRHAMDLLKLGTLHTIQEWNPNHWPEPAGSEPKVTRMAVMSLEQAVRGELDPALNQPARG